MRNRLLLFTLFFILVCISLNVLSVEFTKRQCYDETYVELSSSKYDNETYTVILMNKKNERIRAKYFAAPDNGKSVYKRYIDWSARVQNLVLVSSGTYMDQCDNPETAKPVGLTIDHGVPVNQNLINHKMDALAIVYPSGGSDGGIVVSNLASGDLTLKGGGIDEKRKFDLRKSPYDLDDFMEWAKKQEATIFQTHLLVYKNNLKISSTNSNTAKRERRFFAMGSDADGQWYNIILNCPSSNSLYNSSKKALDFLNKYKEINVSYMINLDTGCQNVMELRNSNCQVNKSVAGTQDVSSAVNLLAFYFQ